MVTIIFKLLNYTTTTTTLSNNIKTIYEIIKMLNINGQQVSLLA
jgi:hypothetical protein